MTKMLPSPPPSLTSSSQLSLDRFFASLSRASGLEELTTLSPSWGETTKPATIRGLNRELVQLALSGAGLPDPKTNQLVPSIDSNGIFKLAKLRFLKT